MKKFIEVVKESMSPELLEQASTVNHLFMNLRELEDKITDLQERHSIALLQFKRQERLYREMLVKEVPDL